jgi:hypothetical protein
MLTPARLSQLIVEVVFLMLGVLVVWLGLTGHINFDRRGMYWLIISLGVTAWGLLALTRPGQWWMRWQKWNRGGSLLLLGLLMLAMTRVPFDVVGKLLAACGVVLALRGVIGSMLILKQQ